MKGKCEKRKKERRRRKIHPHCASKWKNEGTCTESWMKGEVSGNDKSFTFFHYSLSLSLFFSFFSLLLFHLSLILSHSSFQDSLSFARSSSLISFILPLFSHPFHTTLPFNKPLSHGHLDTHPSGGGMTVPSHLSHQMPSTMPSPSKMWGL